MQEILQMGRRNRDENKSVIWIAAVVVILLLLAGNSLVVTYPNEYTVIKEFGRIASITQEPGLSIKIPFIQTAEKFKMRCCFMTLPSAT